VISDPDKVQQPELMLFEQKQLCKLNNKPGKNNWHTMVVIGDEKGRRQVTS